MAPRGRHRRYKPSTVSRASLTVTASGAGIALPLVGISHVQAAPVDVWDKVATCESTNRWHVNTGNGYYGGLQFKQTTWQEFGGTAYAARADQATKEQQIAVAEKVLSKQGPGAWPSCSVRAGLTRDMANPSGQRATIAAQATPRAKTQEKTQEKEPAKAATTPSGGKQESSRGGASYEVERGDSLYAIATRQDVDGGWQRLYERNRQIVGGDPDLIIPGQRLALSPAGPGKKPSTGTASPSGKPSGDTKATDRDQAAAAKKAAEKAAQEKAAQEKAAQEKAAKEKAAQQKAAQEKAAQEKAAAKKAEQEKAAAQQAAAKQKAEQKRQAAAKAASTPAFSSPVKGFSPTTAYRASGASWSSGYHTGVDFAVPTGTSVRSVSSGTVVSAGWAGSYGYQVVVRHQDGRFSQYAHLSAISVRGGQNVNSGQTLGRSGNTGNSTGPHLHFEIRTSAGYGSDVDPLAYLRGKGVTI